MSTTAIIDVAGSETQIFCPAREGYAVQILAVTYSCDRAMGHKWVLDDDTELSGEIYLAKGIPLCMSFNVRPPTFPLGKGVGIQGTGNAIAHLRGICLYEYIVP